MKALPRFFLSRDGKVVVVQFPNLLLWMWGISSIIALIIDESSIKDGFQLLARASLFAWAFQETTSGESQFRRILGIIVLVSLVVSFFIN